MKVKELIDTLRTYDCELQVGWYYDGKWREVEPVDVELVKGTDEWGEPESDSVSVAYS